MDQSFLAALFWTLLGFSAVVPLVLVAVALFLGTRKPRHPWTWWVVAGAVVCVAPFPYLISPWGETLLWAAGNEAHEHGNLRAIGLLCTAGFASEDEWMYGAIRDGHADIVEYLLSRGANPNHVVAHTRAPIFFEAVQQPNIDIFHMFLQAGAAPAVRLAGGFTAMHAVAGGGTPEMAEELLGRGLEINMTTSDGRTLLLLAIVLGNEPMTQWCVHHGAVVSPSASAILVRQMRSSERLQRHANTAIPLILDHGADVNAADEEGHTLLWSAVQMKDDSLADYLLSRGATADASMVTLLATEWTTPNATGERVMERALDQLKSLNIQDSDGATLLWLAASVGNASLAEKLLVRGADTAIVDSTGRTLLHAAALGGNASLVQRFLDMGFPVRGLDNNLQTPLHAAAANGAFDYSLNTPLYEGAVNDTTQVVELLFARGARWEEYDKNHDTPLHFAAGSGKAAVVRALLEHGARPEVRNNEGLSCSDVAGPNAAKAMREHLARSRGR